MLDFLVLRWLVGKVFPDVAHAKRTTCNLKRPNCARFDRSRSNVFQWNGKLDGPRRLVFGLADVPIGIPAIASPAAFADPAPMIDDETVRRSVISIKIDGEFNSVAAVQVGISWPGKFPGIVVVPLDFLTGESSVQKLIIVGENGNVVF